MEWGTSVKKTVVPLLFNNHSIREYLFPRLTKLTELFSTRTYVQENFTITAHKREYLSFIKKGGNYYPT
jgi:hypothetical protein